MRKYDEFLPVGNIGKELCGSTRSESNLLPYMGKVTMEDDSLRCAIPFAVAVIDAGKKPRQFFSRNHLPTWLPSNSGMRS